jgi:isoleucyl-tRNA synthetase
VRLGKEVLSRTVEAYRKIRNTFKYLLSNLYDFDPARDMVEPARLLERRSVRALASTAA